MMPFDASGLGVLIAVCVALFIFAMGFGLASLFHPVKVMGDDPPAGRSDVHAEALEKICRLKPSQAYLAKLIAMKALGKGWYERHPDSPAIPDDLWQHVGRTEWDERDTRDEHGGRVMEQPSRILK